MTGMHCASCASNIRRKLKKTPGITDADVNYASEEAQVTYDPHVATTGNIRDAVASLGYGADIPDVHAGRDHMKHDDGSIAVIRAQLMVSGVISAYLMAVMFPGIPMWMADPRLQLLLATPVQFWAGYRYYVSALRALKNGMSNMNTLIALGTSVAYFFSAAVVLFGRDLMELGIETHTYFETSAAIITLITLGKFLEVRAKRRASDAVARLLNLQAKEARVVRDGKEMLIPLDNVRIDNTVIVKPGEKIPVDGMITKGSADIDESMVTGESVPVTKTAGETVVGSTMNTNGHLTIRVTKTGSDTFLAHIVELVKKAQSSRAPIQKLVDRVSSVFVPFVIALSVIAFGLWFFFGPEPVFLNALVSMIAVLIVACPCALGLATPTSIMVGIGKGAEEGILIKDAEFLESTGKITAVVFDKTGTLTEGKPALKKFDFAPGVKDTKGVRKLIVSLEAQSHHPLADAVVRAFPKEATEYIDTYRDIPGKGVKGTAGKQLVLAGTLTFLKEQGVKPDTSLVEASEAFSKHGWTPAHAAVNGMHVAVMGIADTVKDTAKEVVASLQEKGICTVMVTGDNERTARAIAKKAGIKDVRAEVLPQEKQQIIADLKKEGQIVAMAGDGINDAPALAAADVGIAMGLGTDAAIESAGVTLLRSDISLIPRAVSLSRVTIINIRQNLFWAFGYNVLLIPVAMGALFPAFGIRLHPVLASAAMAFSSVSVVLNALRLRRARL